MAEEITPEWMRLRIDGSNSGAAENRNLYPIQEQATQMDIWEYVPCTCDEGCTCRKFGCTHHWKLKKEISFEQFRNGFLRMFVSKNHHMAVINALEGRGTEKLTTRSIWAYHILKNLKTNWPEISSVAAQHNKTLFCDDWLPQSLHTRMSFPVEGTSVYLAKQFSALFPDIGVPYDTASRVKMLSHFCLSGVNYIEFLTHVRNEFLNCITRHNLTIPTLRCFDNPENRVPFNSAQIALPREGMNYGTRYSPPQRTISLVLDKCFYNPKMPANAADHGRSRKTVWKNVSSVKADFTVPTYVIRPLSGNGSDISVVKGQSEREILWGKLNFQISDEMISIIYNGFFAQPGKWYQLGASMTEPTPSGLGEFIKKSFPSFTPRHASAVAAVMVHEGFLITRGKKPIELMRNG